MSLESLSEQAAGFIYDCDGTIADTMGLHFEVWRAELSAYGFDFKRELFWELAGAPTQATVEIINERFGLNLPAAAIAAQRETRFIKMMDDLKPVTAVVEHIQRYAGRKPLAVASGGKRESVHHILSGLGLLEIFDAVICAEDYRRGKPSPDPFLTAAARLKLPPENCLVFEDAEAGFRAAAAAGMKCVRVGWDGRLSF